MGSPKDKILRSFLLKQASKEIAKNRVMVLASMAILGASNGSRGSMDAIVNNWSNYVNLELYMESIIEERETDMREEYEKWKTVKPKVEFKKNDEGNVAMAISVSSLTPKMQ